MKLSQLSETLNIQGRLNSRDEPLYDEIVKIRFKLLNLSIHFDRTEAKHQLEQLQKYLEAVPVDEPKIDWETALKRDIIEELKQVSRNLDAKTLFDFTESLNGFLVSITKDARYDSRRI